VIAPSGTTAQGVPIYTHLSGTAFNLVIESRTGTNHVLAGNLAYEPDLLFFPDLQIEASRDLGNGSPAVCDSSGSNAGGVPGIDPPDFQSTRLNVAVVNDLACRFVNGSGQPVARTSSEACTPSGSSGSGFGFVNPLSMLQFCAPITRVLEFPAGDTLLTARVQDINATPGPTAQIVVRIGVSPSPAAPTPTPPATATVAIPRTQTPTAPPTSARSGTPVPTATAALPTPTVTTARTAQPASPTPSSSSTGPVITFFGLARSDDTLLPPDTTTPGGLAVYLRTNGVGFSLVVEGKPGSNRQPVGRSSYQSDLSSLPDLQIEVSRSLGNGSPDVCDNAGPTAGGVPAIDPPRFDSSGEVTDAVNDLACRFVDGSGHPLGRGPSEGCILFSGGDQGFVDSSSTIQFCGAVGRALAFPSGDTTVTARLLDVNGTAGAMAQLVVHVGG